MKGSLKCVQQKPSTRKLLAQQISQQMTQLGKTELCSHNFLLVHYQQQYNLLWTFTTHNHYHFTVTRIISNTLPPIHHLKHNITWPKLVNHGRRTLLKSLKCRHNERTANYDAISPSGPLKRLKSYYVKHYYYFSVTWLCVDSSGQNTN